MKRITAEERALARASVYRLLSLVFAYPMRGRVAELRQATDVAHVGAELIDERTSDAMAEWLSALNRVNDLDLEQMYQSTFTLSYSEDCPLYETAFSARHIFQQTQQQADIVGFYKAFGVDPAGERPDHLSLELEFLYLLCLKEAVAREEAVPEHVTTCRAAQRAFVRDHLARWAPQISGRIAIAGRQTPYEAGARLLAAFLGREERFLQLGTVDRFTDEPVLIADEPGEFSCPLDGAPTPVTIGPATTAEGGRNADAELV